MDGVADGVTLSLIICTRDRAAKLKRCLRRVGEIKSAVEWELVLVNNGSHDHTAEVIDDFAKSASFPVSQVFEESPGNGRARNAGLTLAQGDIVAFSELFIAGYPPEDLVLKPAFQAACRAAVEVISVCCLSASALMRTEASWPSARSFAACALNEAFMRSYTELCTWLGRSILVMRTSTSVTPSCSAAAPGRSS